MRIRHTTEIIFDSAREMLAFAGYRRLLRAVRKHSNPKRKAERVDRP